MKSFLYFKQAVYNLWPALLGLLLGGISMLSLLIGFDFSYFPGDYGDARFNNYILEHCHLYFTGQEKSFWEAPFLFPEERIITYSDNLVGTAPIYSFFRILNFSTITAFQLWIVCLFILNYFCSYSFIKWLTKNRYSAVIGAYIFTFSIALFSQIANIQTLPRFFVPLGIWAALIYWRNLNPKYLFYTLLILALQFYAGIYLGLMLAIPIGIILLLAIINNRKIFISQLIKDYNWWLKTIGSILLFFILLYILLEPYYTHSQRIKAYSFEFVSEFIPTLRSYIFTYPGSVIWEALSHTGEGVFKYNAMHRIFPGILPLLSVIAMAWIIYRKKKSPVYTSIISKEILIVSLTFLITFLLFIKVGDFSMYKLLFSLPGYGAIRDVARIINIELLFLGIFVSIVATILFNRYKKYSLSLFLLFLILLSLDNAMSEKYIPRKEKVLAKSRITALQKRMHDIPKGSIVSYEPEKKLYDSHVYQIDAMLATQSLGLISINGYTATAPYVFDKYWGNPNSIYRNEWLESKGVVLDTIYVLR